MKEPFFTSPIQEAEINEQLLKSAEDIFGDFLPLSRLETANDATNEIIESEVDEWEVVKDTIVKIEAMKKQ